MLVSLFVYRGRTLNFPFVRRSRPRPVEAYWSIETQSHGSVVFCYLFKHIAILQLHLSRYLRVTTLLLGQLTGSTKRGQGHCDLCLCLKQLRSLSLSLARLTRFHPMVLKQVPVPIESCNVPASSANEATLSEQR